jgi:hypothetical protein
MPPTEKKEKIKKIGNWGKKMHSPPPPLPSFVIRQTFLLLKNSRRSFCTGIEVRGGGGRGGERESGEGRERVNSKLERRNVKREYKAATERK